MTSTTQTDPWGSIRDLLHDRGMRWTPQRRTLIEVLSKADGHVGGADLVERCRAVDPTTTPSTVYRTLQALADGGEVDTLRTEDGEALYRRCSGTHHHHLVCRGCGRTVEVEGPTVERWADAVADRHGFTEISHTLEIFGTCPDCRRNN